MSPERTMARATKAWNNRAGAEINVLKYEDDFRYSKHAGFHDVDILYVRVDEKSPEVVF
jgi:hypothetical protein